MTAAGGRPRAGGRQVAQEPTSQDPGGAARVTSRLPLLVWLTAVWTGLWGDISAANVLGGLVIGTAVLALLPLPVTRGRGRARLVPTLRLLAVFAADLVKANVVVAWQVLRVSTGLGRPLRQAVIACPLRGRSDRLTTVVANMVSLTPGTLTVEIDRVEALIYVHTLDLDSPDGLRAEVLALEARVVEAFGSDEALAALRSGAGPLAARPGSRGRAGA